MIVTDHTNGRQTQDLVASLVEANVKVLVDARLSTRYPLDGRFKPERLKPILESIGIQYIRCARLGNPFKSIRDIKEMERLYKEHVVKEQEFIDLKRWTSDNPISVFSLLCYCEPPRPCHRFWLKQLLEDPET